MACPPLAWRARRSHGVPVARITLIADIPESECRESPPGLVIRREDAAVPMPMLLRRRHEIGEPVEELKRREYGVAADGVCLVPQG